MTEHKRHKISSYPLLLVLSVSLVCLLCTVLVSQDTLQVKVDLVTVGVRVTDSRGRDVRGLKTEHFSVFDDGVPQKIEFFSDEEQPITLGILFDHSDSMKYNAKIDRAKEAALALVRSAHERSELFYITFDDVVTLEQDFTTDRKRIESAIQKTKLGGGTSLYDAVFRGVERTSRASLSRQAIVVISDGTDQNSRRRLKDVIAVLRESKIQVYTIGYFGGNEEQLFRRSGSRLELIDGTQIDNPRIVLNQLAKESGGLSFFPKSDRELARAIEEITNDLRTQYTVAFYPQSSDAERRYHELRVTVRGGRYNVRARPGYGARQ
jgi:Ca-activated chloride channel family protein